MRVAIVGAGLAGLTTAVELAPEHDVTVYERRDEVGGRVRSTDSDGYVFDRGFQVLFTAYPEARRYLDYDALDLRDYSPGARIASDDGLSTLADPLRAPRDAVASLLSNDATFADKLRVLRLRTTLSRRSRDELFGGEDETVREYLRDRGFSSHFIERFAEPFYGGITLDRSLETSSSVFEFTFSCLSRGRTVVPAQGMGAITHQLADDARDAGARFVTGTRVEEVTAKGDAVGVESGGSEEYDTAVVATDPQTAERLTGVPTPDGGRGCTTAYYVLDEPLDVGMKLVLNADRRDGEPSHIAPVSEIAPEHAPQGTPMVSATWLGTRDDTGALDEGMSAALGRWGFDTEAERVHVDTIGFAQFDQPPGFRASLPSNEAPEGNVLLAGDYTEDSSINGAMLSGRRAAEAVGSSE
ncbi:MAG: phytoene dehydrogenase-like protein [Methanobacteriota archaeon]|jgi:phytoene dehydrogenase-like protein|uniref:NAD(P)/FAD-dependent oxidoreductase n=1 Tax=Halorutilus salinus TaxID=2487751 RepID=A0A9Q4GJI3_9EURY|nr:NAD(P)/FAD-dependent oxidoreductase [Halorutilus salinus]MCX2819953.1 NAD(P)/FAD-dependent oxidoreductase [Halorutilus salinus]